MRTRLCGLPQPVLNSQIRIRNRWMRASQLAGSPSTLRTPRFTPRGMGMDCAGFGDSSRFAGEMIRDSGCETRVCRRRIPCRFAEHGSRLFADSFHVLRGAAYVCWQRNLLPVRRWQLSSAARWLGFVGSDAGQAEVLTEDSLERSGTRRKNVERVSPGDEPGGVLRGMFALESVEPQERQQHETRLRGVVRTKPPRV